MDLWLAGRLSGNVGCQAGDVQAWGGGSTNWGTGSWIPVSSSPAPMRGVFRVPVDLPAGRAANPIGSIWPYCAQGRIAGQSKLCPLARNFANRYRLPVTQNDQIDHLTVTQVSRVTGVSSSSLKRWIDEGRLAAWKTAGGHRRIAVGEVLRFVREQRIEVQDRAMLRGAAQPASRNGALRSSQGEPVAGQLYHCLVSDDEAATADLIITLFRAGMDIPSLCDGALRDSMARIATLGLSESEIIILEHRASDRLVGALHRLRASLSSPPRSAPVALGGAMESDPYQLPSLAAAMTLIEAGYRVHNLGPNLPIRALQHAIETYRPRLVWMSASTTSSGAELARLAGRVGKFAQARHARVVLGGRGISGLQILNAPGVEILESMRELAIFARGIRNTAPPP